jgi:ornithine cyclodeaminase/alanine dehydrogenase-like protein (mu-crystallin family)
MKPLRHLSAAEVSAAMPALDDQIALAERAMGALGRDAEMPAKIGVHPRPIGSLAHAMPALLRGSAPDGSDDLIGVKWIAGFPDNPVRGLPTYSALVVVNDSTTGQPLAVMDAGAITLHRTAAISGVAMRLFAPAVAARPARVAILGAGAQAHSHLPIVGRILPGAEVTVTDTDPDRARQLAQESGLIAGIGSVAVADTVRQAVEGADVVVSVVSFGPRHQVLDPLWLESSMLFVAVDYDMQAPAALAAESLFLVDERAQFLATRGETYFAGYRDPDATIGDALRGDVMRRASRILVSHLGVGLADVVFASAILEQAERLGLGRILPR